MELKVNRYGLCDLLERSQYQVFPYFIWVLNTYNQKVHTIFGALNLKWYKADETSATQQKKPNSSLILHNFRCDEIKEAELEAACKDYINTISTFPFWTPCIREHFQLELRLRLSPLQLHLQIGEIAWRRTLGKRLLSLLAHLSSINGILNY